MKKNVELVVAEYEFPPTLNDSLGNCILYIEFFAFKSVCAYDIHTGQVRLVRKLRKKLDQVVHQELTSMETDILNKGTRILNALDSCLQRLEALFQETNTLGNAVRFGSIGFDGIVQAKANDLIYKQHEQVLVETYQRLFLEKQELLAKLESSQWDV
uniref:hypothetical protein n=1 Tax=Enterococcus faecalis TaxID=1351 RepID=UPI00359CA586